MPEKFTFELTIPFVVLSRKTVAALFRGIYEMLGQHGGDSLLYTVGYKTGKSYVWEEKKATTLRKEELLSKCIKADSLAKWGNFEYKIDFDRFRGEVILYDSFLAKSWRNSFEREQKKPVCAFISGYIAGVIESVLGERVIVEEKMCMAMGDDYCLFTVRRGVLGD
jgi:hypothetical protein